MWKNFEDFDLKLIEELYLLSNEDFKVKMSELFIENYSIFFVNSCENDEIKSFN